MLPFVFVVGLSFEPMLFLHGFMKLSYNRYILVLTFLLLIHDLILRYWVDMVIHTDVDDEIVQC